MRAVKLIIIALNLFVGGLMISGGLEKFKGEMPSPSKMIEQVKSGEDIAPNEHVLILKNYIFGMKQTGYFWPFLGIVELLAGALLISQLFSKIGAFIAFPVTLNIFLFHVFLEPDETGELAIMSAMLIANIFLILRTYKTWKPLLYDKEAFALKG